MAKKEINKNFRIDEEFALWLGQFMLDVDCSLSEVIRTSLLLAYGQIMANPALLRLVTLEQVKGLQYSRNGENGGS